MGWDFPTEREEKRRVLLESVERVRDCIEAGIESSESQARLDDHTFQALYDAGLFALKLPVVLGGAEADPVTQIEVIEALSRIDASSGWCVMIGATTIALQAVFLPDEAIVQMFADGQMPMAAGALMPTGEALPEPGGYRVSGRWAFASGIRHAQWVNATVRVRQPDRDPAAWRRMVLPVSSVTLHDNWDAVGLKGTGSCDFSVTGCFVPESFSWGLQQAPRRGGRLYHLGLPGFAANEHAAFALGVARHALDLITDRASSKSRGFDQTRVASRPAFQRDLGECDMQWRAARAMVIEVFETAWTTLCAGRQPSPAAQAEMRSAATLATRMALDIVTRAFRYAGGEAVYGADALQRCWRDLNTAAQHFMVSDTAYENHGKYLLDLPDAQPFG